MSPTWFGRLPNDPRKPRARLFRQPGAALTPPAQADWLSIGQDWGVLGNDTVGDCTAAGAGHAAMVWAHFGSRHDITVSEQDVLAMYEAISGYNPADPSTDVGATLQDALGYWRTTGVAGHRIAAFAQIDPTDLDLVRSCIAVFGTVYAGMNFPASAMTEFNENQTWQVVRRSRIEGGHCVPLGAYDADKLSCVTWGRVQDMTWDFYSRYFDEAWVPLSLDWIAATGTSPAGLDTDTLNADFQALTGQPGPFPQAAPTPTPTPDPTPTPVPVPSPAPSGDADGELAAAVHTWLAAKGL